MRSDFHTNRLPLFTKNSENEIWGNGGGNMARPAKVAKTQKAHLTLAESGARDFVEGAVKGEGEVPAPPKYLTDSQKKTYKNIVNRLKDSGILGALDGYILTTCAIAIDRLGEIEKRINDHPELLSNASFMASKDKYTKDYFRCCNELCLSPQARAKVGSLASQAVQQQTDPLLQALRMEGT